MSVVWSTNTAVEGGGDSVIVLPYEGSWIPGESIESPNGDFRLHFQGDGNLVLLQLPTTVLWASGTNGLGATLLVMQGDGNLVIYAGVTPLWGSGTSGHPGSYLQLQDDGNLVLYSFGGIEPIGVFAILPNWQDQVVETLEWLTSVTESPLAVEQRMGLRLSPRKMVEMSHTLFGPKRTYFDLFITAGGGSPIYLPLFYDVGKIGSALSIGDTTISVDTTYSELRDCRRAVLISDASVPVYEVIEIWAHSDTELTLVAGIKKNWSIGTKIYPAIKVKVETQPSGNRHADRAYKARTRFISLDSNNSSATVSFGLFQNQLVLEEEPNEVSPLSFQYDRKTFSIDRKVGLQQISDIAPFINESYSWYAKGRPALWRLRAIFYALQGRRRPIWIPSYFSDFELVANTAADATVLNVKRCGYSDTGGPFANREFILIHMRSGVRIYRKITAAAIVGAEGLTENLSLDSAPGINLTADNVLRISFLHFSRLDQDSIELTHHTDTKGLTTANSVFRGDPGIDGVGPSWSNPEVDPAGPPAAPGPHTVFDPFRPADGKVWLYQPGFGTFAGSDWIRMHWASRRPESELIADNPNLPAGLDVAFPPFHISGDGGTITLPDTGSFTVRAGVQFVPQSGSPDNIYMRIVIGNGNYVVEDITILGAIAGSGQRAEMQTEIRKSIYYSKADPDQPLTASIWFKFTGSGNLYPICNPTADCEPYHGDASASGGDSYFIIEWWR